MVTATKKVMPNMAFCRPGITGAHDAVCRVPLFDRDLLWCSFREWQDVGGVAATSMPRGPDNSGCQLDIKLAHDIAPDGVLKFFE